MISRWSSLQRDRHLFLTGLRLGLNRHADHRLGKFHGLQYDRMFLVTERIARRRILQTHRSGDVTGIHMLDIFSVVGMHLQDAAESLTLTLCRVHDGLSGLQLSGVHAEEAELSDKRVCHDLERERGEGRFIAGFARLGFVSLGILAFHRRNIQRRRHVIHNRIQELLHAFVFIGSAAGDGDHFHRHGGLPYGSADFVRGHVFSRQIEFHDLIVEIGHGLQELITVLLREFTHVLGNFLNMHVLAEVIVIDIGVHIHQIDDTLECFLTADGELNGHCVALQSVMYHIQHMIEIRAHDVHLVHIDHAGNMIVIRLPPDSFGLRLPTPPFAHSTVTHPSSTRSERSTSTVKST